MHVTTSNISKPVTTLFLITILLIIPILVYATELEDYQAAKNQNTIENWDAYLKKYPKGENVKAARVSYDNLLWQQAEKVMQSPTELENIFKRCKTPSVSDKVYKLWDNALWTDVKKVDTKEAYRKYLLRFPGGANVKEAKVAMEKVAWHHCQESGKIEFYESYLKEYPDGTYAKEAREAMDDFEYQSAKEKDTIEAYEAFLKERYGHKAASKRLRQLRYEKAVKTGDLEDWKAFYNEYQYSSWSDDGKEIEQMKDNARQEIERLLYETIVTNPTLELCRDYLARYSDGPHEKQVMLKMEPCLFEAAMRTNNIEPCFGYLEKYPEGYRDLELRKHIDALLFKPLKEKEDFSSFEQYLRLSPKTKDLLLTKMEPLMFEWAKRVNTVDAYDQYLNRYPNGSHLKEVQTGMDPVLFKKAQAVDWYSSYGEYLAKCPNGTNIEKAKERIAWLKANKAVIELDYAKELEESASPYSNVERPFWEWNTVFKETGGKVGFRISGSGYILDSKGKKWVSQWGNSISRSEIVIPAGGTGKDSYWFGSSDHELCNSYAIFTWTGEDAGGHPISFETKVYCTHKDCPGPKKTE